MYLEESMGLHVVNPHYLCNRFRNGKGTVREGVENNFSNVKKHIYYVNNHFYYYRASARQKTEA